MLHDHEIAEMESLIENGLVTKRKHPSMDIWICNYTPYMQYRNAWTPVGERCRGLIVDADWNILANPLPKFFNLGERLEIADLPDEPPIITEKLDGFMGVLYDENGYPAIATRGSFESPMALWATEWLRSNGWKMRNFLHGYTYVFEIINPQLCRKHGMVVDYGDRSECVLLAVRETSTGWELSHRSEAREIGLPFAKMCNTSIEDAINDMPTMRGKEQEGYVCKYSNGLRIKLKADEYKRIHRMLKGLTPKLILNTLIEHGHDGISDMLKGVPDETFDRVHHIISQIKEDKEHSVDEARKIYDIVVKIPTRREQADVIRRSPYSAIVFAMIDEKDYSTIALRRVRKVVCSFGE